LLGDRNKPEYKFSMALIYSTDYLEVVSPNEKPTLQNVDIPQRDRKDRFSEKSCYR